MAQSAEELADAAILRDKIQSAKNGIVGYLDTLDRATEITLEQCGYKGKTNAEAMRDAFHRYQKNVLELTRAHVKKWPDDGR